MFTLRNDSAETQYHFFLAPTLVPWKEYLGAALGSGPWKAVCIKVSTDLHMPALKCRQQSVTLIQ